MHRTISPKAHGAFIDYPLVAVLFLAPSLFNFEGTPRTLSYILAFALLGLSLLTAYPTGLAKLIPFPVHGGIELGAGMLALVAPFLFGFTEQGGATAFFILSGISVFVVWALTNYKAADQYRRDFAARRRVQV